MNGRVLVLGGLWLVPIVAGLFAQRLRSERVARWLAVAVSLLVLLVGCVLGATGVALGPYELESASAESTYHYHLRLDGLTLVLVLLAAVQAAMVSAARPSLDTWASDHGNALITFGATIGTLVSQDVLWLVGFFVLSSAPLTWGLRRRGNVGAARMVLLVQTLSGLGLLVAALVLVAAGHARGLAHPSDLGMLTQAGVRGPSWSAVVAVIAVLIRLGVVPFHAWGPASVSHGSGSLAFLVVASPVGPYTFARILWPLFPELSQRFEPALVMLGMFSGLYGCLLAIGQQDLRRLAGYILVSTQGFLLAGLASLVREAVDGAWLNLLGSSLSVTGLALAALALEARAGSADLRRLGGVARQVPRLATGFFMFTMAAVGFPGTVGFVSEDMLIQGFLENHLGVAAVCLLVTAVNGITLFRAFKRAFLGEKGIATTRTVSTMVDLLPRELIPLFVGMALLLAGGFVPWPLVTMRTALPNLDVHLEHAVPAHFQH